MAQFLKTVVFTGVPFGLVMGLFWSFQYHFALGIPAGLGAGLLFGLLMGGFLAWQGARFKGIDPCEEGEHLLHQGPANHSRGLENAGGWLYLTDRRLLFRSHRYNVTKRELSIPLAKIREVQPRASLGIIPNGIRILTAQGKEDFVVQQRKQWLQALHDAVPTSKQ